MIKRLFTLLVLAISILPLAAQNETADLTSWMAKLDDNALVCHLSIPGVHDAVTGAGFSGIARGGVIFGSDIGKNYAQTQDLNISDLFDHGVRAFDLRPAVTNATFSPKSLMIFHGILQTNTSFIDAITNIVDKVKNTSEFAIIIMRHEDDSESDDEKSKWADQIIQVLTDGAIRPYLADFKPDLRVRDLRGKVLVLSRDEYTDGPIGGYIAGWSSDANFNNQIHGNIHTSTTSTTAYTQDYFDVSAAGAADIKDNAIRTLMDHSTKMSFGGGNTWIINNISGYTKTINLFGNSICTSDGYRDNAARTNKLVAEYLDSHLGTAGIVMMDYAGVANSNGYNVNGDLAVQKLIESNFKKPSTIATSTFQGESIADATDKDVYLYNVETGKWIQGIDASNRRSDDNWSTGANMGSIGINFKIIPHNGNYYLDPHYAPNHMPANYGDGGVLYLDAGDNLGDYEYQLTPVDGIANGYLIASNDGHWLGVDNNGNLINDASNNYTWQLVSLDERTGNMLKQDASVDKPVDATFLVDGWDFSTGDQEFDNDWTIDGIGNNHALNRGYRYTSVGEFWDINNGSLTKTITVPNGRYRLSAQGFVSPTNAASLNRDDYDAYKANPNDTKAALFMNNDRENMPSIYSETSNTSIADKMTRDLGNGVFMADGIGQIANDMADGKYQSRDVETTVSDGQLKLGVDVANGDGKAWFGIDNIRLSYLGPATSAQSPFLGQSISEASGNEVYLYNVETGKWIQGIDANNRRSDQNFNTGANMGDVGINFKITPHNNNYYLDSHYFPNHMSADYGDGDVLYLDGNGDNFSDYEYRFTPVHGVSNGYTIVSTGGRRLGVDDQGNLINDASSNYTWQLVSLTERKDYMLNQQASENKPVDATFLVDGWDFSINDQEFDSDWDIEGIANHTRSRGFKYTSLGEYWDIDNGSVTKIITVPNGRYRLSAQGFASPTNAVSLNSDDYNAYKANPDDSKAALFMNNERVNMPSIYSETSNTRIADKMTRDLGNGVFMADGIAEIANDMADGKYQSQVVETIVNDGQLKLGVDVKDGNGKAWIGLDNVRLSYLGPVAPVNARIGINEYASFYYGGQNLIVPEGVEAYTYNDQGQVSHTYMSGDIIPASTGVIIGGASSNYEFPVTLTQGYSDPNNALRGTDEAKTITSSGYYYKLSLDRNNTPGTIGFYWDSADGHTIRNGAHKAYLFIPAGGNAKPSFLLGNMSTGISGVEAITKDDMPRHNLQGQRVSKSYKGIVIVNGKKIVNK